MPAFVFPCPCCGYFTFSGPPGSYELCAICCWEDDAAQLEYATSLSGGANAPTLQEAQQNFITYGSHDPSCASLVREPTSEDRKDPSWRPIDLTKDSFETWESTTNIRAPAADTTLYYWLPIYWRHNH